MNKKNLTYKQALIELETIVSEIEQGKIDLDQLVEKVKRAKQLFNYCYTKLRSIKTEVDNIFEQESDFSINDSDINQSL